MEVMVPVEDEPPCGCDRLGRLRRARWVLITVTLVFGVACVFVAVGARDWDFECASTEGVVEEKKVDTYMTYNPILKITEVHTRLVVRVGGECFVVSRTEYDLLVVGDRVVVDCHGNIRRA